MQGNNEQIAFFKTVVLKCIRLTYLHLCWQFNRFNIHRFWLLPKKLIYVSVTLTSSHPCKQYTACCALSGYKYDLITTLIFVSP